MMPETRLTQHALPEGYSYIPRGNPYITSRCRRQTEAAQQTIYTIIDELNTKLGPIGIAVPTDILDIVQLKEQDTREQRTAQVAQHDAYIEATFKREMMRMYPKIPETSIPQVVQTALKKGQGKVGRSARIEMQEKVYFAVRAHIRHVFTNYDAMLNGKDTTKWEARKEIAAQVASIAASWGEPSEAPEFRELLPGHMEEEDEYKDDERSSPRQIPGSATKRITRSITREENKITAGNIRKKTKKTRSARKKAARLARAADGY
ncbi:hypothetical protein N0V93_009229 [Gnomoniopsis smithogilvyi]|uniref:DUF2293 domain-containing protein n=1 Tax=Gnomoniopsis smithogilvyi TaxID=1191159 RepID=A0A9W9CSI4_9PEZI|nr:hypothetical protein N0V93_009229 [Gnomoniopsis smithogilvyi]